jgi:hypothetical protein
MIESATRHAINREGRWFKKKGILKVAGKERMREKVGFR